VCWTTESHSLSIWIRTSRATMFKEYTGVEERSQVRQLTESRPLFQAGLEPAERRCLKSIDDQEQEVK